MGMTDRQKNDLTGFERNNIDHYIREAANSGVALTVADFGFDDNLDGGQVTLDGQIAGDRVEQIGRRGRR